MDDPIRNLIEEFKRLPGVGEKTAQRYAYFIVSLVDRDARKMAGAIVDVKEKIKVCSICYNFSNTDPCIICSDKRRENGQICVVEDPRDMMAIEKSVVFKGRYHILHGAISPIMGIGPDELRIEELRRRVKGGEATEVIIATNPTKEGEATAHFIQERLKDLPVMITRIARGVPVGGDLEYFDPQTLSEAISNRKRF
ncbi:MAG: recombination protein RecR [Deltaproteobacteria bacterium]|uniref:Recombination protein RecR n=1 Tax=Candidatus Zymogenus saltonus TaxID=2844893 RepID=A0A9D8KEA7_9DELT|nr:recombination protein RecR [Candidatus Zymogenus saltonus]